jgi:glycine/serine hydroxymethyltransferase
LASSRILEIGPSPQPIDRIEVTSCNTYLYIYEAEKVRIRPKSGKMGSKKVLLEVTK